MAYYQIQDTDNMEGHKFEYFCADVLRKNGFEDVRVTPGSGDSGADIIAKKKDINGFITYVIQCKRYSDKVGVKAVQEAYFAKSRYGGMIAVVLTNNYFTKQAIEDAQSTGVRLWNRDALSKLIKSAYPTKPLRSNRWKVETTYPEQASKNESVGCLTEIISFILAVLFFGLILHGCVAVFAPSSKDENTKQNSDESSISEIEKPSIWAKEYTPLSDFEYYIDDDGIHIKDCNSRSKTIYVAATYDYEGRNLPVAAIERGSVFNSCDSIIISEGITNIDNAAFNGCGAKYVYLPSTLTDFNGWSYFHKGEKIYYGGDKDSWNSIFTWKRSSLDFVEIICDASISDLLDMG